MSIPTHMSYMALGLPVVPRATNPFALIPTSLSINFLPSQNSSQLRLAKIGVDYGKFQQLIDHPLESGPIERTDYYLKASFFYLAIQQ